MNSIYAQPARRYHLARRKRQCVRGRAQLFHFASEKRQFLPVSLLNSPAMPPKPEVSGKCSVACRQIFTHQFTGLPRAGSGVSNASRGTNAEVQVALIILRIRGRARHARATSAVLGNALRLLMRASMRVALHTHRHGSAALRYCIIMAHAKYSFEMKHEYAASSVCQSNGAPYRTVRLVDMRRYIALGDASRPTSARRITVATGRHFVRSLPAFISAMMPPLLMRRSTLTSRQ